MQQALPSRLPAGWVSLHNVHAVLLPSLTALQTLPRIASFLPLPMWDGEPGGALPLPPAGSFWEGEGGAGPCSKVFNGTLSARQECLCLPQFSHSFKNRNAPREGMVRFRGRAPRSSCQEASPPSQSPLLCLSPAVLCLKGHCSVHRYVLATAFSQSESLPHSKRGQF